MKRQMKPVLAALVLIVIVVIFSAIYSIIEKMTPTKEKADLYQVYDISKDAENQVAVIMQNTLNKNIKGLLVEGHIYIDIDTVKEYFNSRFYWDNNENVLIYTTPTDVIKAELGSKDFYVSKTKNSVDYEIVKTDGNQVYISIDFVQSYSNIDYSFQTEPNRVCITYQWDKRNYATVKDESEIRVKGNIKSPVVKQVDKKEEVTVISEGKTWVKVRTEDDLIGYIKKKSLSKIKEEALTREFEAPVYTSITKDYKINLAWHQVTVPSANDALDDMLANVKGVNTISPTWFKLEDNEGNITSLADMDYVNQAHGEGLEVWALVDDFSDTVDQYQLLSYSSKREYLINQLIAAAIEYNLDGLNIDFENISVEAGEHFVEFLRELSVKCRNNGIVLSVDNYAPTSSTEHYDRTEQGIIADYVILMGYDEHWAGCGEAGSVASLPFVKDGILNTLKEVPASKLIHAIPFYTRIWIETPEALAEAGDTVIQDVDGNYVLNSQAVGMDAADDALERNGVEPIWIDDIGQYYGEYQKDGSTCRIWLEEERSIEEKLKLMQENNLAGVAFWKLGFERSDIWDVIQKYTN